MLKKISLALVALVAAAAAQAGPTCQVPQEKWMDQGEFKARLSRDGYDIKTFKVSKGKCYEIYGYDKAGRKVEIYFDPSSGAVLESN